MNLLHQELKLKWLCSASPVGLNLRAAPVGHSIRSSFCLLLACSQPDIQAARICLLRVRYASIAVLLWWVFLLESSSPFNLCRRPQFRSLIKRFLFTQFGRNTFISTVNPRILSYLQLTVIGWSKPWDQHSFWSRHHFDIKKKSKIKNLHDHPKLKIHFASFICTLPHTDSQ